VIDIPFLAAAITALSFLVVAFGLLRRASRTGAAPERLLGVAFLLIGTSYVFSVAPYAFALEPLLEPFSLVGRITYAVSVIGIAVFTLRVLQSDEAWTRWLVYGSAFLIAAGIGLTVLEKDLGGFNPLRSYGYWLEWAGLLFPFVWMGLAAFAQFGKAGQRVRLGLCDPVVSNRFLLLSLFGFFQVCGFFVEAALYIISESQQKWTAEMDVLYATTEILSILTIWLAFFPPAPYRRWIGSQEATESSRRG
jgi:hypothetical protein